MRGSGHRAVPILATAVRVHIVDPAAWTRPYDHALCTALAELGASVTLVTTHFPLEETTVPQNYRVERAFRRRPGRGGSIGRRAARLAFHVPEMLAYARRTSLAADVVHFQWLTIEEVDSWLLPQTRPRVMTSHDVLARDPRRGQHLGQRRLYERMDAVIVHSDHGARRLREDVGLDPARVHVIPHGAFHHLARVPPGSLPPELTPPADGVPRPGDGEAQDRPPVALFFGLLRPYKGVDILIDAWRRADVPEGAELWIVGKPLKMEAAALRRTAPASVRWALRFVSTAELAALFRRVDIVVLPYREIDQSGVLFTALAFGVPLLLTDVGGFPEVAATGAAELVAPEDAVGLAEALGRLLRDPTLRARLAAAARAAAAPQGPFGWARIAGRTMQVYEAVRLASGAR